MIIKQINLGHKELPNNLNNFTIAHLTDFHYLENNNTIKELKKIFSRVKVDLIAITGDFVEKKPNELAKFINFLSDKSKYGVFGVLGNHDYHNIHLFEELIKHSKLKILKNQNIKLKNLSIIGVDCSVYDDPLNLNYANLKKAMKGVPKKSFKLLLAHSPDIIQEAKNNNIDLVLCGHMHGGQIRLPFIGAVYTSSKYGKKYTSGIFKENKTFMIVSNGIGNSKFPFFPFRLRLLCPEEIIFIKLIKKT